MCLAEPITNDVGFTVINKTNYDIGDGNGISRKVHFYAQLADLAYQTSGPDRSVIIRAPWDIYDASKGPNDWVPYEKVVDNDNLMIYTPYGTLNKTTFPLATYPNYIVLRGSQTLFDYWKIANLITLQPNINDNNSYDTHVDTFKGLITNFLTEEDGYLTGNRNLVFLGHSQGGMIALDIYHQLFSQYQHLLSQDCLHIFNPFIIPTPEYQEIREICKDNTHDDYTAYRANINIHKTKDDFASSLVKIVGVGNVYVYPNVVESQYFNGILNTAYETYKTYANHRMTNFSGEGATNEAARHPYGMTEYVHATSFMLSEKQNDRPIIMRTKMAEVMTTYFDEGAITHHLKLRNVGGTLKIDTRKGEGIDNTSYEFSVSNIDKSTFYEYDITESQETTTYISPLYTLTNAGASLFVHIKYTGDPIASGQEPTYNIIDSDGKVYQFKQVAFNLKKYPEDIDLVAITSFTQAGRSANYLLRGQWQLLDSQDNLINGLSSKWYIDGPRRLLSYNPTEELFFHTFGFSSTQFNTYLISVASYYVEGNQMMGYPVNTHSKTVLASGSNTEYYTALPNYVGDNAKFGTVEGESVAVSPDSEVWNLSFDSTLVSWNISNTQETGQSHTRLQYHGATSDNYSYDSSLQTTPLHDIPTSAFPYTNHYLEITYKESMTNGDRMYQLSFNYNGVKHYLLSTEHTYSLNNGHYGYIEIVSQTRLDAITPSIEYATYFKIADNVATGSGI